MRDLCRAGRWRLPPLQLQIDDLQGRRVLELVDACPLLELPLPPGTYHVRSQCGPVHRAYTLVLEPGKPFTLVL